MGINVISTYETKININKKVIQSSPVRNSSFLASPHFCSLTPPPPRKPQSPFRSFSRSSHSSRKNSVSRTLFPMRSTNNTFCCISSSYMCSKSTRIVLLPSMLHISLHCVVYFCTIRIRIFMNRTLRFENIYSMTLDIRYFCNYKKTFLELLPPNY